ncbi:MAG: hypothetical protein K6E19_09775 [Lachnospiraceae bacterium]|nr:hypothetical protein [Lachnospiraceae bacterium]
MKRYINVIVATLLALVLISCAGVILCLKLAGDERATDPSEVSAEVSVSVSGLYVETKQGIVGSSEAAEAKQEEMPESKTEEKTEVKAEEKPEEKAEVKTEEKTEEKTEVSVEEKTEKKEEEKVEEKTEAKAEEKEEKQEETPAVEQEEVKAAEPEEWPDLTAPVFLYYKGAPQIKVGDSFDIHKYAGYADDVDRNVDFKVAGEVDTAAVGTYPLKLTLTDDAGRTTVKDMEVHVVTEITSSGGGMAKEQFSDFISNFKTEENKLGIDISRWQGNPDFAKIKAAGCEFVYMRIGGYDSGEFFIDKSYRQNMADAKAQGLMVGVYWYGEEDTYDKVVASVKYLMEILNGEPLDFPIAYDWEDYRNFEYHGMNLHDLNACFANFEKEVEKYGYMACLYGSKNAQQTIWTDEKKNPVWLAHYNVATSYSDPFFMWQRSNTGRIDGINGDVDLDIFYPDRLP